MTLLSVRATRPTFTRALAEYKAARQIAISHPGDSAAHERYGKATERLLVAKPDGYRDLNRKIAIAIAEQRTGPDLLRALFVDTYEAPGDDALRRELARARDTLAEGLETMYFSFCEFADGERQPAPCPEEAELIAARERQLAEIEQVLAQA